ncbi:MAG: DUF2835 domain-containing protein [Algicola sp.]|nr:DUF2835 domain-containing protein [Algicola sp.]
MVIYNFSMGMSAAKCKKIYEGTIRYLVVTSDSGETVQLPASRFRPFVTTSGISGRFRLSLDDDHKFVALEKTY